MYDEWDEIIFRIEKEHGVEAAQRFSDAIDDGSISTFIDETYRESDQPSS